MNEEIGTEAAQFPEKEYINGIFLAVCVSIGRVDTRIVCEEHKKTHKREAVITIHIWLYQVISLYSS